MICLIKKKFLDKGKIEIANYAYLTSRHSKIKNMDVIGMPEKSKYNKIRDKFKYCFFIGISFFIWIIYPIISNSEEIEIFNSLTKRFDSTWVYRWGQPWDYEQVGFNDFFDNIKVTIKVKDNDLSRFLNSRSLIVITFEKNLLPTGYTPLYSQQRETYGMFSLGQGLIYLGIPRTIQIDEKDFLNKIVGWYELRYQSYREIPPQNVCYAETMEYIFESLLGAVPGGSLVNIAWKLGRYQNCMANGEEEAIRKSQLVASRNHKIFTEIWDSRYLLLNPSEKIEIIIPIKNEKEDLMDEIYHKKLAIYIDVPVTVHYENSFVDSRLKALSENISYQILDSDNDGLSDWWESKYGQLNPNVDDDNDGLTNLQEYYYRTNPLQADTDGDGIPDGWEVNNNLNPLIRDSLLDIDADGKTCLEEYINGINPNKFSGNHIWEHFDYPISFDTNKSNPPEGLYSDNINFKVEVLDGQNSQESKLKLTIESISPSVLINGKGFMQVSIPWELNIDRKNVETRYFVNDTTSYLINICDEELETLYQDLATLALEATGYGEVANILNALFIALNSISIFDCYKTEAFISSNYHLGNPNTHDFLSFYWPEQPMNARKIEFVIPVLENKNAVYSKIAYPTRRISIFTNFKKYVGGVNTGVKAYKTLIGGTPDNLDSDFDGLPDNWEITFGLNPFSIQGYDGTNGDPDGDGYTNYQEYKGGGNPKNSQSLPIQDMDVVVNIGSSYNIGENAQLKVSIRDQDGSLLNVNEQDVDFIVKNSSGVVVLSDFCRGSNGSYSYSFSIDDRFLAGAFIVNVMVKKTGFKDALVQTSFTVNQPNPRLDAGIVGVEWNNPKEDDFQINLDESIIAQLVVKNYGTIMCDIPIILEIVGTNKSSKKTIYNVEPGQSVGSTLSLSPFGLTDGFYTIRVRTDLQDDSNPSNNIETRDILIGQRTIIPNRLPLQSYKLYQRIYIGPLQTTPAVTISAGGLSYTITTTYIDNNSSWFNISGVGSFQLFKDKLYSIDTNNDGKLDNDKLFIAVNGNSYYPKTNTYYFDFQVGIYDENTNAQQTNPDRVVNRIASCIGSLSGMAERAKAKYDYYLEPGKSNYYSFLHVFNPELNQSTLDGYICRWSFSNRDSSGSPVGNYGGSLYMYYPFISGGRIDDYYVIVPSPTMPSREYDLLIIQEQEIDMTGSDFFRHLGYAHSVRMRVEDYHEAEVTSILLPTSMRSGESYTVQVQIKNNGDVPENGIPVSLNITSNSGYNITMNKNSGNIPAGATQIIDFPWETLGLSSDTYTFSVLISVNGDQNTDNNSKSVQQQLLPPYSLGITGSLDKLEYGEGEVITLNVSVKDDLQNPVSGASVSYKVKKGGVEVNLGTAYDQGNGSYLVQFNAPYIPGTYLIEITASKIGYLSGFNNEIIFLVKDTIKPTIPILMNPINNSNISTQEVNFDWLYSIDFASGIAAYKIQVSKRIDFSILDIDTQTIASNYSTNLIPGIYYWRVRSIDNANNQSDWSNISKFTVDIEAPLIQITNPTPNPSYSTIQPTINIGGSASDNIGVTQVTWANNRGGGGIAIGTDSWVINEITLFEGENIITVTARDAAGNVNNDTLTVNYVSSSHPFPFFDDFGTDRGWTGYEAGGWERKPATAGGGENGNPDPAMDHSPTNDNYVLGFAIGGDYPNGLIEEKSIISPPINCSGQSRVFLKFWRYLNVENNSSDHARVYVSSDGVNWIQLWENPVYDLKDNQWVQVVYDISAIAANQPTVYIKFTMGRTNSSGRFSGWNIDDLEVTSEHSGPMAIYLPYANIPNPNIDEILIQKGFGITHSSSVPSDLSNYSLLILQSYDASNQTTADRIKDFVQNGGGAIIMSGTPSRLASPTQGVGTTNLSYIKDWFGASWYDNDCGYATIVKDHPFGTDLVTNDKVNYCPTDKCWAPAVYGLNSNSIAISQWSNNGRVDSFIHTFGKGRVLYYAGNPGYSEDPDPTLIDNSLTLFEAGLAWASDQYNISPAPPTNLRILPHSYHVMLAWNPNTEPDLAGYKIHYGTSSRSYGPPINVGNVITFLITGLDPRYTYFFAVTAYDTSNNESGFSNEVVWPNRDIIDFDGDGRSDVLWQHPSSGTVALWLMNGITISSVGVVGAVPTDWEIKGIGDFNADIRSDVLWYHPATGTVAIWLMDGMNISSVGVPGAVPNDWEIKGTGDFNNDGKSDVLWFHPATGTVAIWLMDGMNISSVGVPGAVPNDWEIKGTGDFNNDGKSDVLWFHPATGTVAIWLMDGMTISSVGVPGAVPYDWAIKGTGDFNNDGKSDVLWFHPATGTVALWMMDGTNISSVGVAGAVPSGWEIKGTGDFNNDGKSDVLWFHPSTGTVAIWLMDGMNISSVGVAGAVPGGWEIKN